MNKEGGRLSLKPMISSSCVSISVSYTHLSNIHHPIVGDKKYGATTNPLRRLGLHAHAFGFIHPVTKKKYEFKVDCPKGFYGKK